MPGADKHPPDVREIVLSELGDNKTYEFRLKAYYKLIAPDGTDVFIASDANDATLRATTRRDKGIVVDKPKGVRVTEAAGPGHTETYGVVLNAEPSEPVEVSVSTIDPETQTVMAGIVTVSPASLTFTTADWNLWQSVTVTAVDDESKQGDRSVSLRHVASTGDYTSMSFTAYVIDDDAPLVTLDLAPAAEVDERTVVTVTASLDLSLIHI